MERILFVVFAIGGMINLILSLLIYFNAKKQPGAIFMSFASFAASLWSIGSYLFYNEDVAQQTFFFDRFTYVTALLITLFFLLFSIYFIKRVNIKKFSIIFLSFPIIILSLITIAGPGVIVSYSVSKAVITSLVTGEFYGLYCLLLMSYWIVAFFALLSKRKFVSSQIQSRQISVIFWGCLLLFIIAFNFSLVFPYFGILKMYWTGSVVATLFFVVVTYAILKHHLFDIKVPINEVLAFLLVVGSFLQLFFAEGVVARRVAWGVFFVTIVIAVILIRSTLALVKREKMIQEMLESKRDFLRLASHQLKTPLSVMMGTVDILREIDPATLSRKELDILLDGLDEKTEKLRSVVGDMIEAVDVDTGEIDGHTGPIYSEQTSMKDVVSGVVKEFRPLAGDKGLRVNVNLDNPLEQYYVKSMPTAMHRVVSIVLDNAINYTKEGKIDISLRHEHGGKQVVLEVSDTGIGVPPEDIDRIFDKFERGSNALEAHSDGSGIALYVARKIINRHEGGRIEIESALGKGTTVTISVREYK